MPHVSFPFYTGLTCSGTANSNCLSCDPDLIFDNGATTCVGLSTANGQAYNTQIVQNIDAASTSSSGYLTGIDDANGNTYASVTAYIADKSIGSSYILLSSTASGTFNKFKVDMALLPANMYKYSIKISGLFDGTCPANEINLLSVTTADSVTNQQHLPLQYAYNTSFRVSTSHIAADGLRSLSVTLGFISSNAVCAPITVASIAIVGFICDGTCSTCSISTPCACNSPSTYVTALNKCASCSTGC